MKSKKRCTILVKKGTHPFRHTHLPLMVRPGRLSLVEFWGLALIKSHNQQRDPKWPGTVALGVALGGRERERREGERERREGEERERREGRREREGRERERERREGGREKGGRERERREGERERDRP